MTEAITAPRLTLGRSDLSVCPVGLGCLSLSGVYGDPDDAFPSLDRLEGVSCKKGGWCRLGDSNT